MNTNGARELLTSLTNIGRPMFTIFCIEFALRIMGSQNNFCQFLIFYAKLKKIYRQIGRKVISGYIHKKLGPVTHLGHPDGTGHS